MPLLKADGVQPRAASSFLRASFLRPRDADVARLVRTGCICFSYFFPLFYSGSPRPRVHSVSEWHATSGRCTVDSRCDWATDENGKHPRLSGRASVKWFPSRSISRSFPVSVNHTSLKSLSRWFPRFH